MPEFIESYNQELDRRARQRPRRVSAEEWKQMFAKARAKKAVKKIETEMPASEPEKRQMPDTTREVREKLAELKEIRRIKQWLKEKPWLESSEEAKEKIPEPAKAIVAPEARAPEVPSGPTAEQRAEEQGDELRQRRLLKLHDDTAWALDVARQAKGGKFSDEKIRVGRDLRSSLEAELSALLPADLAARQRIMEERQRELADQNRDLPAYDKELDDWRTWRSEALNRLRGLHEVKARIKRIYGQSAENLAVEQEEAEGEAGLLDKVAGWWERAVRGRVSPDQDLDWLLRRWQEKKLLLEDALYKDDRSTVLDEDEEKRDEEIERAAEGRRRVEEINAVLEQMSDDLDDYEVGTIRLWRAWFEAKGKELESLEHELKDLGQSRDIRKYPIYRLDVGALPRLKKQMLILGARQLAERKARDMGRR